MRGQNSETSKVQEDEGQLERETNNSERFRSEMTSTASWLRKRKAEK